MNKSCKHQKVYENKMFFTYPPQVRWICKDCGESGTDIAIIQDGKTEYVKTYSGFEALDRMKTNWLQITNRPTDPIGLKHIFKRGDNGIISKVIYKEEIGDMSIEGSNYKLSWFSENTFIDVDIESLNK